MASEQHTRNRGNLFDNKEKRKPSQPDLRGECTLEGATYDVQGWRRDEQLTLTLAPTRTGNTYPPDAFKGTLEAGESPSSKGGAAPVWVGDVVGDDVAYVVRAFQKQGKSGPYLSLVFELGD
ncbi:MAG: hypothetical protein KF901_06160 [Myxococcales bacterium]|nr:hypothetical protein [Myxococcales bacterium]